MGVLTIDDHVSLSEARPISLPRKLSINHSVGISSENPLSGVIQLHWFCEALHTLEFAVCVLALQCSSICATTQEPASKAEKSLVCNATPQATPVPMIVGEVAVCPCHPILEFQWSDLECSSFNIDSMLQTKDASGSDN